MAATIRMDISPGEVMADTINTILRYYDTNKEIGDNKYGVSIYLRYKTEIDDNDTVYYKLYPMAYEVDYKADNDTGVGHICTYGKGYITNQIAENKELLAQYVNTRFYDAMDEMADYLWRDLFL